MGVQSNVGRKSLRSEAIALLDSMPDAGQAVVELRYGVQAQKALDEAIKDHQWKSIADVARMYCFTKAGRDAAWLLVEQRLGRGLPLEAAVALEELMKRSKSRQQFGVGGQFFLAKCWMAAGREDLALAAIKIGKSAFPNAKPTWKGKSVDLSRPPAEILRQFTDSEVITATTFKTNEPLWVGGDLQRNADSSIGLPVPLTNWKYWMHESIQHEDGTYKTVKDKQVDRNSILVPSRVPIVVYPWVISMSYGQRINAVHLKTGKMVWGGSFSTIPFDLSMERFGTNGSGVSGVTAQDYLLNRIWGESAVGQLSSDGKNLYCIAEAASVDAIDSLALGMHSNVVRPIARGSYNYLQSLSIEEQGKLLWEVGGATGIADPALAGVLFLGTPISYEGELLAMGELNGEVFLLSINPSDGHLRWRQQLIANTAGPLASDSRRRNQSCVPSVSGGVCICPTLSGQIVAVNLNSRSLAWSLPYSQDLSLIQSQRNAFGGPPTNDLNPLEMRSSDSGVIISGDSVIHAPSDGNTVYAAGLLDGELRWELSKNSILYVAAAWQDRVLLVGDQLLYCVDIKTGKNVWQNPLSLASIGRVVGRGGRNGHHYFLPMSNQEILDVDLREGKIAGRMRVASPLGNLVSTADQIISLSPIELTAYSIRDRVRDEVDLEFAAGSVTASGLQRKSKIYLAEGNTELALDSAEKAYRMDKSDDEVQILLRYIALRALQEDFDKYAMRIAEYERLISNGLERKQYLISVIDGLIRRGDSLNVTKKLLELQSDMYQRRFAGSSLGETIDPETNLVTQNDIWTSAKLAQLYEASSPDSRLRMVEMIESRLMELTKSISLNDIEARSDMFRWLPLATPLRMAVAEKMFASGDLLLAEQLLEETYEVLSASQTVTGIVLSENVKNQLTQMSKLRLSIYNMTGRWTASVALAVKLGEPLQSINTEPTSLTTAIPMRRPKSLMGSTTLEDLNRIAEGVMGWPQGKAKAVSKLVESPLQSIQSTEYCPTKQIIGDALNGWIVYLQHGAIELVGPTGGQRITIQGELSIHGGDQTGVTTHFIDSIVLLEMPTEVIAIDTLRAAMNDNRVTASSGDCFLWRESFAAKGSEELNRGSRMVKETTPWGSDRLKNRRGFAIGPANRYGVIVSQASTQGSSIVSLDPRTGTRRWVRTGFGSQLSIAQEGHTLIVIDSAKSERLLIDARDGRLVSSFPIDTKWDVWTSAGKHILTTKVDKVEGDAIIFKLFDGLTGAVSIEKSFPKGTVAEILQSDGENPKCLVAWKKEQPLVFWNLESGKEYTYEVPMKSTLKSIGLERSGNKVLILPYSGSSMKIDVVQSEATERFRNVSGPMLAIDPADGHPIWKSPVVVHDFRFPLTQVRNTPAIILTRPLKFKANGIVNTETGSIAVLDSRNGNLLYNDNYLPFFHGTQFQSMTRPGAAQVVFQYHGSEVEVTWTDEPNEATENEDVEREIGKIDRKSIQSGVPPKLLERLQSGESFNDSYGRDADYDQLFQQEEDQ